MPVENGKQGTEKQYPEKLRDKIDKGEGAGKVAFPDPAAAPLGADAGAAGHTPTAEETRTAIKEEIEPEPEYPLGPEAAHDARFAEASLAKKITVFSLTTVLVLIALGAIYTYWPAGQMPMPH